MLFCYTGIISAARVHLYLPLLLHRDYFRRPDSSPACSFAPQGLFCPGRMHLYLALLLHRDYFRRPNASLSCSFVPQGLFPPVGFISIFLFCSTEIISTGQMHLCLALLSHRDYFRRPDASLSCFSVPQGLFRPAECISNPGFCKVSATKLYYTGNTRMASADTLCKKLPQDRQKTKCFISFCFIFLPIW